MDNTIEIKGADQITELMEWCEQNLPQDAWRVEFENWFRGIYTVTIDDPDYLLAARIKFFQ